MSIESGRDWWQDFNELMAQIASADEPYSLSVRKGFLVEAMTHSVTASRLYQIWAALEDKYERCHDEPGGSHEADALMRNAARQWLAVKDDETAQDSYLDHWQYDICGYERD